MLFLLHLIKLNKTEYLLYFVSAAKQNILINFQTRSCRKILRTIFSLGSKDNQDIFLQRLIEVSDIHRRRTRVQVENKPTPKVFKNNVNKATYTIEVCLKPFISICIFTTSRVRRVFSVLGQTPRDLHGRNTSVIELGEDV